MKIKILYLIGAFETGGKERQLAELIKGLNSSDFKLFIMMRSDGAHYLEEMDKNLVTIYNLNRKHFSWDAIFEIGKIIKEVSPDVVHSWASITSVYALLVKWLYGIKFIFIDGSIRQANPRGSLSKLEKLMRYLIGKFSNYIIANSKAGHKEYLTSPKKAHVIYNGFNFERILNLKSKEVVLSKYNISNYFIIGMVARFDPQKDWTTFIHTAVKLALKDKDIAFICVGDGSLLDEHKKLVPLGIQNQIIFTGQISEVESLVNTFDIAVLLSNNEIHGEGISNSITEYMSLGKPVIVNDNGGNKELINNDEVGIIIERSDCELLEKQILILKNSPEKRSLLGRNARKRIKECFSYEAMITNYSLFYKSILS
jgi:glycosyltransferase involved in cell wall biosynthesis